MNNIQTVSTAICVVILSGLMMFGCARTKEQNTLRMRECVQSGGSFVYGSDNGPICIRSGSFL